MAAIRFFTVMPVVEMSPVITPLEVNVRLPEGSTSLTEEKEPSEACCTGSLVSARESETMLTRAPEDVRENPLSPEPSNDW